MIYLEKEKTMNVYGTRIRDRWMTTAPRRTSELEDSTRFFEELGDQVAARVAEISTSIAGPDSTTEDYISKAGRLTAATRQAEELAMAELEWPEPEMNSAEELAEWEATSTPDQWLVDWAAAQETTPFEDELEILSAEWMLPVSMLRELATSSNPSTYLVEHSELMEASRELRFQRRNRG